jgi:hypothetical protein
MDGLMECPREDLAEWITEHFMAWKPQAPKRRSKLLA